MRLICLIFIVAVLLLIRPLPSIAQEDKELSDDNLVILKISLSRYPLGDVMPAYYQDETLYLPLGELMFRLQIPIDVNVVEGNAKGWFIEEEREFELKRYRQDVVIDGKNITIEKGDIVYQTDDIYVKKEALEKWFPFLLNFNKLWQMVEVQTLETLPLEASLNRQGRQLSGGESYVAPEYPRVEKPYSMLSMPSVDMQISSGFDSQNERTLETDFSVLATGDILKMNHLLFVSGDENSGLSKVRLRFDRKDIDSSLFPPLNAGEIAIGDVFSPKVEMVAQSTDGRGVILTNINDSYTRTSDTVIIRGDISPDWEVELYRNDTLLQFQKVGENGQYEFLDVPLLTGFNNMRLVFYGPFGEKREETRSFFNDPNIGDKGKISYRFVVNQDSKDLIDVNKDDNAQNDAFGQERIFMEAAYNLTDNMSLNSSYISLPLETGEREAYLSTGIDTSFAGISNGFQYIKALKNQGDAFRVFAQANIKSINITAEHQEFLNGFVSERTDIFADPFIRQTFMRVDGNVNIGFSRPIGYGFRADYKQHKSGRIEKLFSNRLSTYIQMAYISHTLLYDYDEGLPGNNNEKSEELEGDLLLSVRPFKNWNLRGQAVYGIKPLLDMSRTNLSLEYRPTIMLNYRLGLEHNFENGNVTSGSFQVNRSYDFFKLGVNSRVDSDNEVQLGVSLSVGLGKNPQSGEWKSSYEQIANQGAVAPRVYLDNNQNSVFDEGDEPLKDVKFNIGRVKAEGQTNNEGAVLLNRIPVYYPTNIELATESMEDPYWSPVNKGWEVVARPGVPVELDFPILITGEVDGTVYIFADGKKNEAAGVELQLVDKNDEVVKAARTSYDGFYLFDRVPLGIYSLRVLPEQMQKLDYENLSEQKSIKITYDEPVNVGNDITIQAVNQ